MERPFKIAFIVLSVIVSACGENKSVNTLKNPIVERAEDVVLGNENAPATVFMYGSYHCNYCRYFFSRTYPELKKNFLDTDQVKMVIKWVDPSDNPQILRALQAASCISQYGTYEKFHELLLVNPDVIFTEDFTGLVDDIMMQNPEIEECIMSDPDFTYLRNNMKEFSNNDLTGTPTFVLNNHVYSGFISYENFVKLLKKEF